MIEKFFITCKEEDFVIFSLFGALRWNCYEYLIFLQLSLIKYFVRTNQDIKRQLLVLRCTIFDM